MSQTAFRAHPLDARGEAAIRAVSVSSRERAGLGPEAERRVDRLLSFDPALDDGWEDWPYEHYPGESCPLTAHTLHRDDDASWDAAFAEMEAYTEPERRG